MGCVNAQREAGVTERQILQVKLSWSVIKQGSCGFLHTPLKVVLHLRVSVSVKTSRRLQNEKPQYFSMNTSLPQTPSNVDLPFEQHGSIFTPCPPSLPV